ncbi:hypothetical protein MRB53_030485 [Persea americana]|uniref:Uncharacterized protein n=1 Tax=Persea americana TaxID=3435 RepID=A0ACC2KLC9_PERAE|nr:hypothetical protein MRB53_030485 [Persea americana]
MMSISAARLVDWGKSEEEERQRGEMAKSRLGPLPVPQIPNHLQGLLLNEIIAVLVAPVQASTLQHRRKVWFEASTISNSQSALEPKKRERKTKEPDFPITKVNEATTFYYCKALPEKKGTMSGPSAPPEEQGILQEDWEKTAVASEDMINTA